LTCAKIEFLLWNSSPRRHVLTSTLHAMVWSAASPARRPHSWVFSRKAWDRMFTYQDAVSEPVLLSTLVALIPVAVRHLTLSSNICVRISEAHTPEECRLSRLCSLTSSILTFALEQLDKAEDVAHVLSTSLQAIQLGALSVGLCSLQSVRSSKVHFSPSGVYSWLCPHVEVSKFRSHPAHLLAECLQAE